MIVRGDADRLVPPILVAAAFLATRPLGPLAGTMLLVIVLPVLAESLDTLGWAAIVAEQLRRAKLSAARELLAAYGLWLATSATLTLDVSAVVAVPVGLKLAGSAAPAAEDRDSQGTVANRRQSARAQRGALERSDRSGRHHLAAAILGSNVGSLLFPFSNLTNLIVVSATATPFAAYVEASWAPQLVAAIAVGALLVRRSRHPDPTARHVEAPAPTATTTTTQAAACLSRPAVAGGVFAVLGALTAVLVGFAGGDVAPVFAVVAAITATLATLPRIGADEAGIVRLLRSIPPSGVAIVLFAALASGWLRDLAALLPDPQATLPSFVALPAIALVGGLLAMTVNNLPAAAFGAVWLLGASPDAVVAYLVGTNMLAIATPHGSLATILSRRLASRGGVHIPTREYLLGGWLYATAAGVPALAALLLIR